MFTIPQLTIGEVKAIVQGHKHQQKLIAQKRAKGKR